MRRGRDSGAPVGDRASQTLHLSDGRRLGYAELGDPTGAPFFFLHGAPGSRRILRARDEIEGVRFVCPDRPGYGLSSPQCGRTILTFARDVLELADAIGADRFVVAGTSGGCPYAAAVAWLAPHRVQALGLCASLAPLDASSAQGSDADMTPFRKFAAWAIRKRPGLADPLALFEAWRVDATVRAGVDRLVEELASRSPESDRKLLAEPDTFASYVDSYREAWRQGFRWYAQDLALLVKPWGFRLGDIRVPTFLWHGDADRVTPLYMGLYVAEQIRGCRAKILPGEGHLLRLAHWREITDTLVGCARGA
jgi:pimeloyl-ACP methyl ester carboxylesterase